MPRSHSHTHHHFKHGPPAAVIDETIAAIEAENIIHAVLSKQLEQYHSAFHEKGRTPS